MPDLNQALAVALEAASAAAAIIREAAPHAAPEACTHKSPGDVATATDALAEQAIRRVLLKAYPDHAVLGEEGGQTGNAPCRWIVDPLDGTMNFVHGLPWFAVSLALEVEGEVSVAVVSDPTRGDVYSAVKSGGALLNGRPLRVSQARALLEALVGTVVPPPRWPGLEDYLRRFCALARNVGGVRRSGSAALDLAAVAAGRLDGFFVMNLHLWDVAAGSLLVREAGGQVEPLPGAQGEAQIVAAAPGIMDALLRILA
ncbi:inositol monophosphatase family protein [Fundidesulfovibrio soli]|uniref:inositol monophosphatase family protein n=1 Tax=Fundidesulfovibrio soli TaxID=2922716 RepID=UPI001FAFD60D|nr:inositol monophosphatase family protein [Fundidesulfovibrio soli]